MVKTREIIQKESCYVKEPIPAPGDVGYMNAKKHHPTIYLVMALTLLSAGDTVVDETDTVPVVG